MSKRKDILELLKEETLSAFEISDKTNCPIEFVRVYLGQFIKEKKVMIFGTKNDHKIYGSVDPKNLLKQLYDFMSNNCNIKKIEESDITLLEKIKMVVS